MRRRRNRGAVLVGMAKEKEKSEMREIVRRHLDNKGYVIRVTTHREADTTIARVHVTDANTDDTIAKFVAVGKLDRLETVFGLDASEGIVRDLINQALNLAEILRYIVPRVSVKAE